MFVVWREGRGAGKLELVNEDIEAVLVDGPFRVLYLNLKV